MFTTHVIFTLTKRKAKVNTIRTAHCPLFSRDRFLVRQADEVFGTTHHTLLQLSRRLHHEQTTLVELANHPLAAPFEMGRRLGYGLPPGGRPITGNSHLRDPSHPHSHQQANENSPSTRRGSKPKQFLRHRFV